MQGEKLHMINRYEIYKFYYFELSNPRKYLIEELLCATKAFAITLFQDKHPANEVNLFAIEEAKGKANVDASYADCIIRLAKKHFRT